MRNHNVGIQRDVLPDGIRVTVVVIAIAAFVLEGPLAVARRVGRSEHGELGTWPSGRCELDLAARVLQVYQRGGLRQERLALGRVLRALVVEILAVLLEEVRVQRQVVVPSHHQLAFEVGLLEPADLLGELRVQHVSFAGPGWHGPTGGRSAGNSRCVEMQWEAGGREGLQTSVKLPIFVRSPL